MALHHVTVRRERYRRMVEKMKELKAEGIGQRAIAIRFGVTPTTVSRAINGEHPEWYRTEQARKKIRGGGD